MSGTKIRVRKATTLLREDHRKVKKLFAEFEELEAGDVNEKGELFELIRQELTLHAQIEEELFYPALQQIDDEEVKELVLEAHEEHKIVKTLIAELMEMTPEDESFDAKMKVLIESVKHHAEEEEQDLFPSFEKLPRGTQDQISDQLRARKEELKGGE